MSVKLAAQRVLRRGQQMEVLLVIGQWVVGGKDCNPASVQRPDNRGARPSELDSRGTEARAV
eukprot:9492914-Pyramimonas_sp.AAC.1